MCGSLVWNQQTQRKVWPTCTNPLVGRPEKTRIPPSFANPTKPRWDIINSYYCCHVEHMRKMRRFDRVGLCKLDPFCWCILSWQPPLPWCSGISACLNMGLNHRDQLGILWSWFWRVHQPSVARAEPWVIFSVIQNHPQSNRHTKSGTIVRCAFSGSFWCLLLHQNVASTDVIIKWGQYLWSKQILSRAPDCLGPREPCWKEENIPFFLTKQVSVRELLWRILYRLTTI